MSNHKHKFTAHGIACEFLANACGPDSASQRGTVLHITCGLATLCMWLPSADLRAISHALTMAADEAEMMCAQTDEVPA